MATVKELNSWNKQSGETYMTFYTDDSPYIKIEKLNSDILLSGNTILSDCLNVNIENPQNNQILSYNGSYWINSNKISNNIQKLDENIDVNISNYNKNILKYYNNYWININYIDEISVLSSDTAFKYNSETFYNIYDNTIQKYLSLDFSESNIENGSETYFSRENHKHNNLYSILSHTHIFFTSGISEIININDEVLKQYVDIEIDSGITKNISKTGYTNNYKVITSYFSNILTINSNTTCTILYNDYIGGYLHYKISISYLSGLTGVEYVSFYYDSNIEAEVTNHGNVDLDSIDLYDNDTFLINIMMPDLESIDNRIIVRATSASTNFQIITLE